MIDRSQADWYKDAIIYQLHIKAFFDANNDGLGDFAGLMQKLDYVQELGVDTLWVLPFYPSPLRDDGYDIADYRDVHPSYGTMRDFRRFVRAAHDRNLRVITELVINHTSDQHAWFQRARRAKRGSSYRNYYVWSDTDQHYKETRIIFIDTEPSNWSWDPVANQYFWHRFYHHQPDLNYDNPRVLREILSILRYWLDMGVDGLRLDAIPYLVERDGTINENLPGTHAILKRIRAEIDRYDGRMMLAEANQWPEDVLPYFGTGDECHMAFHFPVMPRMYMAIAQEDRHPLADILRQTPDIPDNCQWGIFLRNHDELTLEMVTDKERDYLWQVYAADKRMRLNLGIRRRLAPLMDNDRRKIQLMNSLLLSMPGTPIVYYGDEIGMGDNIFLGDRDGVRTPMQWSPDRNGGFSRADPARLYLPPIMDSIYGFDAVNVEAQQRDPSSLLNWMRRMITVRQAHPAFGRGTLRLLYPRNRKILAYLRERDGDNILCVANLARSAQAVELDLSEFRGHVPVEVLGRSPFPPIGDLPYLLTLPGHGFYWFVLAEAAELPRWHQPVPEPLPDFITLVMRDGWSSALIGGENARQFAREVLPAFLANQRWFGAKDQKIASARVAGWAELALERASYLLAEIEVGLEGVADPQRYFMPLATTYDDQALTHGWPLLSYSLAQVRRGAKVGALYDAMAGSDFPLAALAAIRRGMEVQGQAGTIRFWATAALDRVEVPPEVEVRRLSVEQSNSSALIGDHVVLKIYRKLAPGQQPEIEIGRFLTEQAGFPNSPPLLGAFERVAADGTASALGAAFGFIRNQGDGWVYTTEYLHRTLDELRLAAAARQAEPGGTEAEDPHGFYLTQARVLGRRTAELHRALAISTADAAFAPEPITKADLQHWQRAARRLADAAFKAARQALPRLQGADRDQAEALLARRQACHERIEALCAGPVAAAKTRIHGDYHLGQVLVAQNDFYILDFEGEPARPLEERRAKSSPLKDVAGMLRSFDYAAWSAVMSLSELDAGSAEIVRSLAERWRRAVEDAFLATYREIIAGCPSYPEDEAEAARLLDLFLLEKALYEICYEAANRPNWLRIPLQGVMGLLEPEPRRDDQG